MTLSTKSCANHKSCSCAPTSSSYSGERDDAKNTSLLASAAVVGIGVGNGFGRGGDKTWVFVGGGSLELGGTTIPPFLGRFIMAVIGLG